ncbi:MAG TPA: two-component regulator propeller domain-containing protein [Pyrinomonadaceae bacterium]|nr:two-component regulator propeller domain-containing protein [Pyrinomonadaceae bacterium]
MRLTRCPFRLFLLVAAIIVPVNFAHGQYRYESWTTDQGLPQNSINDIRQTRDGYIWLTTFDGLVRFDGVRFTVFDKANTPGIISNRFLRMFEDPQGDLWAGTEEGGLVRYHQGVFSNYGKEQGLTNLNAVFLTDDDQGRVVAYFAGEGVMRFADGKLEPINPPNKFAGSSPPSGVARRVPCIHANDRLHCLGYGEWGVAEGMPSLDRISGDGVDDGHGTLWIATRDPALVRVEQAKIVRVYRQGDGLPGRPLGFVTGVRCRLMTVDRDGQVWLTDLTDMRSSALGKNLPADLAPGFSLGYEDREGNLWFGTNRTGLWRARKQFIAGYSKPDGLAGNNVYPIYQARNGVVWIGTTDGLFRYQNDKFEQAAPTLKGLSINAIAEDSQGRLIIGGSRQSWIGDGNQFEEIPELKDFIWAILADNDGSIWFGTEHGLVHLKDGTQTRYKIEDGLAGDNIKVILDDGANGFWIGCFGGLSHYANGKFTSWTERDGLSSSNVRTLHRDADGTLWLGTYDGGLARFKDGKVTTYTTRQGLFNNGVFQILEDGRSNFWISSNHGIYRVRRRDLEEFAQGSRDSITSVAYDKSDGMLNVECNGGRWPAGVKTTDGRLWFPTQDGVAVIQPDAVPVNEQPPPVYVESLLLDNLPVTFGSEVQVRPEQENFEIRYTALSFINSDNIRFKFRLEGLDHDWIDAGTRRTAYYSHVPPGHYTFKVIAANSDGVWNYTGAAIRLNVRPRFYQTWWFQALIVVGVAGLAFGGYRARAQRLERAHRAQEEFSRKLLASQEQERQRIAAELHDSLGQSLLIIKNRIALAQSEIDEKETVEEQLGELSHSTVAAIEECREIAYNLRPYQISRFGLTRSLKGIFMRINEVTEIQAIVAIEPIDDLEETAQINLYRIVQECVNNIIKHSQATRAALRITRNAREASILIEDDGQGFAPDAAAVENGHRGGFGLIGIAERVRILHGTYEIDSRPQGGTRIHIRIPLRENAEGPQV